MMFTSKRIAMSPPFFIAIWLLCHLGMENDNCLLTIPLHYISEILVHSSFWKSWLNCCTTNEKQSITRTYRKEPLEIVKKTVLFNTKNITTCDKINITLPPAKKKPTNKLTKPNPNPTHPSLPLFHLNKSSKQWMYSTIILLICDHDLTL